MRLRADLKVLQQGADVRRLHAALAAAGHAVTGAEAAHGRFGRRTFEALRAFQESADRAPTGIADAETRTLLDAGLSAQDETRPWVDPAARTFDHTERLGGSLRGLVRRPGAAGLAIRNALTATLKTRLTDAFPAPSAPLADAIRALDIDLDEVADTQLDELIATQIAPELARDPALEDELFSPGAAPESDGETVAEALGLDRDARETGQFGAILNRARNEALGDILGLGADAQAALSGIAIAEAPDRLDALVAGGVLAAEDARGLSVLAGFARLTDDNFAAVRALHDSAIRSPRELAQMGIGDWQTFITENNVAPPEGLSVERYAEAIDAGVEATFRTVYAMVRHAGPPPAVLDRLSLLDSLPLGDRPVFEGGEPRPDLDLSVFAEESEAREGLMELARFANRYDGLGVTDILNDGALPVSAKRTRIEARLAALTRFSESTPNLDLRYANFTQIEDATLTRFSVPLDGLEAEDRAPVRRAMMQLQRAFHITERFAETDALLAAGLNTARAVAEVGPAARLAALTGLSEPAARRIRARALESTAHTTHFLHALEAAAGHRSFDPAVLGKVWGGDGGTSLVNALRNIPGYEELFGPQNYCRCKHCQSIFSPAAYFVDLMRFIDRKISEPNFIDPGRTDHNLYLRNRRPGLWSLPLTCENTDTPVIYLVIVNDVLEAYLESQGPEASDIFAFLATEARSSFRQPFNLPYAELQIYLGHLGLDLVTITALFDPAGRPQPHAVLDVSPQEFATIATAEPEAVRFRFANHPPSDLAVHRVASLLRAMGIGRDMLDRYLALEFVAANVAATIAVLPEDGDPAALVGFFEELTIAAPEGGEDPVRAFLDRLHRIVRLTRALGWTPEEVALAIDTFAGHGPAAPADPAAFGARLGAALLARLAQASTLRNALGLTVAELIALCDRIPEQPLAPGVPSLRETLLGSRDTLEIRHPALANTLAPEDGVSPDFGVLQGALGLAEPDLIALLLRRLGPDVIATANVGLTEIGVLYSAARLARGLGIASSDLARLEVAVPGLAPAGSPGDRLEAFTLAAAVRDEAAAIGIDLTVLLTHLPDSATEAKRLAQATAVLTELAARIAGEEQLLLGPSDLTAIEGVTAAAAGGILAHLASGPEPWLVQAEVGRFRLTDAVSTAPNATEIAGALESLGTLVAPQDDPLAQSVVAALVRLLAERHPVHLVREGIRTALDIKEPMLTALAPFLAPIESVFQPSLGLSAWLAADGAPPPGPLAAYAAELIRLADLFAGTLAATPEAVSTIASTPALFGIEIEESWTLRALLDIAWYARAPRSGGDNSGALDRALLSWTATGFPGDAAADLARHFEVEVEIVRGLLAELPAAEAPMPALRRLEHALAITRRSGLDAGALRQLTGESYAALVSARDVALGAVRVKYPDDAEWRAVEETFIERVAGLTRDTLVDRILSRPALGFENERDIYHVFLLDPEMDGCFRTSRIGAAISSVQLYVQRAFMGLERGGDPGTAEEITVVVAGGNATRDEWVWRKTYRVWEANRKVFLYPESYMFPDAHLGKSHILEAAGRDLMQANLDAATIEQTFRRYLDEFLAVGVLEVVSALWDRGRYLLVGRTRTEPFRYFTRTLSPGGRWGLWQPVDLDIGARTVSAVRRSGKLHLFWTNVDLASDAERTKNALPQQDPANVETDEDERGSDRGRETLPVTVSYSVRDAAGQWSQPQDVLFYSLLLTDRSLPRNSLLPLSEKIYAEFPHPSISTSSIGNSGVAGFIRLIHPVFHYEPAQGESFWFSQKLGFLRDADNVPIKRNGQPVQPLGHGGSFSDLQRYRMPGLYVRLEGLHLSEARNTSSTAEIDYMMNIGLGEAIASAGGIGGQTALGFRGTDPARIRLHTIQHRALEAILNTGRAQYLIRATGEAGSSIRGGTTEALAEAKWKLVALDSPWPRRLLDALHKDGLDKLLRPSRQIEPVPRTFDLIDYLWLGQIKWPNDDQLPQADHAVAQFRGPHGQYLWEIFFHMPFLIAHTLNAAGKYEEADRWYRRIFDPTASGDEPQAHWRFVVFRTLAQPRLREILTQKAAVEAYLEHPFEPFRIADLRPSAYQKAIFMRYVDNLLDWADDLFRQDTNETINEALLLYVMAADLLGERAIAIGECPVVGNMTYDDILQRSTGGEFLIELENVIAFYLDLSAITPVSPTLPGIEFVPYTLPGGEPPDPDPPMTGIRDLTLATAHFQPFAGEAEAEPARLARAAAARAATPTASVFPDAESMAMEDGPDHEVDIDDIAFGQEDDGPDDPTVPLAESRTLGFCVPPNEVLLGYWDRVEDRLHKIRHCMTIDGIERQLPLWQSEIDPLLLVRARAAGLDLQTVIAALNEQPPQHRFEVLLDRARRFAATARDLGSQLLAALERKDEAELSQLRAVHEDRILGLSRSQRQRAIGEAHVRIDAVEKVAATVQVRIDYYTELLASENEFAVSAEEQTALNEMGESKLRSESAAQVESKAQGKRERGPQWSLGTSAALGWRRDPKHKLTTWGFYFEPPLNVQGSVSWGSHNIEARYERQAFGHRSAASSHDAAAGSSATRAGHKRRQRDWRFELDRANAEKSELEKQRLAAEIQLAVAERDLEIHDRQMDHAREIHDFVRDRFTGLGLHSYLSASLSRLYREAYDLAFKAARTAERAFQFEIGEAKTVLRNDNWSGSRAGLLAGEQLLGQLDAMEASHAERDRRRHEITLSCPLSLVDPDALVRLRQEGLTEFSLPAWYFDLNYPGQYLCWIEWLRLLIPSVTGPHVNVGARLTLLQSAVRVTPSLEASAMQGVQVGRNSSIVASAADGDPGVFELRLDGPRHPPFRGAGIISEWSLGLPRRVRVFDYLSISDVIVELGFTALDDGALRQQMEGSDTEPGVLDAMLAEGYPRIFSLRRDFPDAWHALVGVQQLATEPVAIRLESRHFPYWLRARNIELQSVETAFQPEAGRTIAAADLAGSVEVTVNGSPSANWTDSAALKLPRVQHALGGVLPSPDGVEIAYSLTGFDVQAVHLADIVMRVTIAAA